MRRRLSWLAVSGLVVASLAIAATPPGERDNSPAARAERIARELRCPVCQGLSVADSPSATARAMAADIRRRVDEGEGDAEIREAYIERYGEWILLRPRGDGLSSLVWATPVAVVVAAGGLLALTLVRRGRGASAAGATDADRRLVEQVR